MFKVLLNTVFLCLLLSACVSTGVLDVDRVNVDGLSEASPNVEEVSYLVLKSSNGKMITNLSGIIYRDGKYYLFDREQGLIMAYSQTGDELGYVNAVGHGPGEYVQPMSFDVDGEGNVYVADASRKAIFEYRHGDFSFKKRIDVGVCFVGLGVINENEFWIGSYFRKNSYDGKLAYFNAQSKEIVPICKPVVSAESSVSFGGGTFDFFRSDSLLFFYERFTPYVYRLNEKGICSDTVMIVSGRLPNKKDLKEWVKNPYSQKKSDKIADLSTFLIEHDNIYMAFSDRARTRLWYRMGGENSARFSGIKDSRYYYLNNYFYTTDGESLVSWCDLDMLRGLDENQRTPLAKEILSETDSIGDKVNMVLLKYRFK